MSAKVATNDFVRDNKVMKNPFVVIVHGIGTGIIRKTVHDALKQNKLVKDYKIYMYNNGCIIIIRR